MSGKTKKKVKKGSGGKPLKDYKLEKNGKTRKNSLFRSRNFRIVLIILAILLAGIIFALLVESGYIENPLRSSFSSPELFVIEDSCSLIVGQLIHTIENSDTCEMRCKTECSVREMSFHDSEFVEKENDCNECNCYCK